MSTEPNQPEKREKPDTDKREKPGSQPIYIEKPDDEMDLPDHAAKPRTDKR